MLKLSENKPKFFIILLKLLLKDFMIQNSVYVIRRKDHFIYYFIENVHNLPI